MFPEEEVFDMWVGLGEIEMLLNGSNFVEVRPAKVQVAAIKELIQKLKEVEHA